MPSVVSSLLLLFLIIPSGRATGYDCHWLGTAPICDNSLTTLCPSGYTQLSKSKSATDTEMFGEFGSSCWAYPWLGYKTLCCRDDHAAMIKEKFNEIIRSGMTYNIEDTPFAGFGKVCVTGTKALCCKHSEKPVWEKSCEWLGSSPVCGTSDCPAGKTEIARSKYLPENLYADFGSACITGEKTLCCNSA